MKNIISAFILSLVTFTSTSFAADISAKPATTVPAVAAAAKVTASVQQESVNINTADVQGLTALKGIGPKKAEAIIAWRKANGGFKSVEQFTEVKGIGASTLEANRKNIRLQ